MPAHARTRTGPITSRSAACGSLVNVRTSGRASRRRLSAGPADKPTAVPAMDGVGFAGSERNRLGGPASAGRAALSRPAGCKYQAMSRAGGGEPGTSVQRREPVTNTRTPEGGVPSPSTVSSARQKHHASRRGCRDRAHAPKARSATGQCDRPSAAQRSRPTSRGGRSRTSRPAGTPPAASERRWRDGHWPANTDRPGRDGSTPETTTRRPVSAISASATGSVAAARRIDLGPVNTPRN
jgi:hypothetical protein